MLQKSIAEKVLQTALKSGGDFAEIFLEDTQKTNMQMLSGLLDNAVSGRDHGAGIRVFNGLGSVYVYTNNTSESGLLKAARQAAAAVGSAGVTGMDILLKPTDIENIHPIIIPPQTVSSAKKAEILKRAHHAANDYDELITQVSATYLDQHRRVTIANSDGLLVSDERTYTRLAIRAIASNGKENQTGTENPGAMRGFEFYDTLDVEAKAKNAARIAVTMLKADMCPAGRMPVAIENGFGGVIFHEACGHPLEATSVAKNQSVFCNKLEQKVGSDVLTAIDDGTRINEWGSGNIDDEGTRHQKNVLIENGVLKSYLIDKLNGRRLKMETTGSARRQSYKYSPTSRMTNTYIAPGKSKDSQIIESMENGLYAAALGGGSVNPITGEFNFVVLEGYLVKNGKIEKPVRGATLIGKGSEIVKEIDMVGQNLAMGQGMCGSISGSIPANVGQPLIRVSEITVGGRKEE